jgi:phenylacetic acid degradation operon negative regulatory protein
LTARSVILSVLLGTEPPRLPVQLLVRTAALFGITEGTARTALSRMRDAGEVVAEDGWYSLASERLLARQARQTASRGARTGPWLGGQWIQAVVVTNGRRSVPARAALRAALSSARLAELRSGVWLRPDNLPSLQPAPGRDTLPAGDLWWSHVAWLRSVPVGRPVDLARRLWNLEAWAVHAGTLRERMRCLIGALEAGDRSALVDGFVLSADVLRHLQADPLLPSELLPANWPGDHLRGEYDRYDATYRAMLRDWFAEHR